MYKVVVVVRSLFHQKVDWSGEKNSFLHMINYRVARDFIWKRILENFWIMDLKKYIQSCVLEIGWIHLPFIDNYVFNFPSIYSTVWVDF